MIDLENERLISMKTVARLAAVDGRPRSLRTIHRWIHDGVGGRKLETIDVGGRIATSMEALQRFFRRRADAPDGPHDVTELSWPTEGRRERISRAMELAEAAADAEGL